MSDKERNSSTNKKNSKKQNSRKTSKRSDLDLTTRIRIDQERLEDSDSLDTSFLEGRIGKQVKKGKRSKEKILKESVDMSDVPIKKIAVLALLAAIIISIFIFFPSMKFNSSTKETTKKDKKVIDKVKKEKVKKVIDDNCLFVGDFHTDDLDLEKLDLPYVKVSDKKYETKDILDNMNEKIYQYNPSLVVIELGINDLSEEQSIDDINNHMEKIIDGIKENRPYAKIYIESVYPINRDVEDYDEDILSDVFDNDDIFELNTKLEKLAKKKNVNYLNVYEKIGEKKQLKGEYTDDGVHLNKKGYNEVFSLVKKNIQ